MPQDLPGFHYDAEKNRYFPIKGPIPGSSRLSSTSSATAEKSMSNRNKENNTRRKMRVKTGKLLQVRDLDGNVITSRKGKFNFQEEYLKTQASQPLIWKYQGAKRISDGALEHMHMDINMADGSTGTDILLTGGVNGCLCLVLLQSVRSWKG